MFRGSDRAGNAVPGPGTSEVRLTLSLTFSIGKVDGPDRAQATARPGLSYAFKGAIWSLSGSTVTVRLAVTVTRRHSRVGASLAFRLALRTRTA